MSKEDITHFLQIPWCAALLKDSEYTVTPIAIRSVKPNGKDKLFGSTLHNDDTITAYVSFYKTPLQGEEIKEIYNLVSLEAGLDGYAGICHGGIIAALLDEVMMDLHYTARTIEIERGTVKDRIPTYTVEMNTKYLKPVKTPQTVLLHATLTKIEGRKLFISASVKDENGTVLVVGQGIFVRARSAL